MPRSTGSADGDTASMKMFSDSEVSDGGNAVGIVSNSNVQVVVRVRPPSLKEKEQGYKKSVGVDMAVHSLTLNLMPHLRTFKFDYIADEDVQQDEMFRTVGKPITDACLQGYHCCLIAYGQTGAGKTFTMEGPGLEDGNGEVHEKRGLIPRILDYIFHRMAEERGKNVKVLDYVVKCSYLQIYNEQVADLLDPASINLTIHEDSKTGMYVEGLQEVVVSTAEATYGVFRRGSENRTVGMTAMNLESSRSHSVFTLVVESQRNVGGVMNRRTSRFYLVDLAGSERQKYSETVGIRLKEAGSINKSLSALGNVIKALVDISEGKVRHVPYRDSRLTFLLKDALGGNSKCTLIANVSPAEKNADETLSTLKFAQRAKLMRNTAVVNEDMFGNPATMGEEIKRLRLEIAALRANMGSANFVPSITSAEDAVTESERVSRLEHILSESTKQALLAERKAAAHLQEMKTKLDATQAICDRLETCLQSQKMIIRLRENTIKRLEGGRYPMDTDDHMNELKEENEQLRKQIEHHPDVVKFKMELDLCKEKLDEYEQKNREETSMLQLETLNQSLKQEFEEALKEKQCLQEELSLLKHERDGLKAQALMLEEQFVKLQDAAERFRKDASEAIHKQEKIEEKLREAIQEQDEVWRKCNLAEVQATELAYELQKERSKKSASFGQQNPLQENVLFQLQMANEQCDQAKKIENELLEKLNAALSSNSTLRAQVKDLEEERLRMSKSLDEMRSPGRQEGNKSVNGSIIAEIYQ